MATLITPLITLDMGMDMGDMGMDIGGIDRMGIGLITATGRGVTTDTGKRTWMLSKHADGILRV